MRRSRISFLVVFCMLVLAALSCTLMPEPVTPSRTQIPGPVALPSATITPVPLPFSISLMEKITTTSASEENWATQCRKKGVSKKSITTNFRSKTEQNLDKRYRVGVIREDNLLDIITPIGDFQDVKPTFSPDCTQIAYERDGFSVENAHSKVYIVNEDGSNPRLATSGISNETYVYSPSWQINPDLLVVSISECSPCSDIEISSWHRGFGLVDLAKGGHTTIIRPPPELNWQYMDDASFYQNGTTIAFEVRIGNYMQLAWAEQVTSITPKWIQVTNDAFDHYRPVFLDDPDGSMVYIGTRDGQWDVFLFHKGISYNLTHDFGQCKDPSVKPFSAFSYNVVVTCAHNGDVSDFYEFTLNLK